MSVYNLQIKLDRETEQVLRELAKEDKRPLSSYCRVILMNWVEEQKQQGNIETTYTEPQEIEVVETKKKLKRPSKALKSPSKPVESRTETITLDDDTPKITGLFGMA